MESSQGRLNIKLEVAAFVFLGLACMSPFAVFDTFGVVSSETNGYVPASYIRITIVILFTTLAVEKW